MVARIEELDKEDEHPRIKNGPFLNAYQEKSSWTIMMMKKTSTNY